MFFKKDKNTQEKLKKEYKRLLSNYTASLNFGKTKIDEVSIELNKKKLIEFCNLHTEFNISSLRRK